MREDSLGKRQIILKSRPGDDNRKKVPEAYITAANILVQLILIIWDLEMAGVIEGGAVFSGWYWGKTVVIYCTSGAINKLRFTHQNVVNTARRLLICLVSQCATMNPLMR